MIPFYDRLEEESSFKPEKQLKIDSWQFLSFDESTMLAEIELNFKNPIQVS